MKLTSQQDKFAQLVATGKSQADAYREAYPRSVKWTKQTLWNRASELAAHSGVMGRVEDLRGPIQAAAIAKAGTTKAWVMDRLREVVERCMQARAVLDKKGNPVMVEKAEGNLVPAYTFEPGGANRALELLGKEFGMFIARKMQVENPLDGFSHAELREFYNELVALRGAQTAGTDAPAPIRKMPALVGAICLGIAEGRPV